MAGSRVQLIPWDPESPQHIERLIEQRKQVGWDQDKVAVSWRDGQRAGKKCLYWIIYHPEDAADFETKLASHYANYPKDKEPLTDTGASLRGAPRQPTGVRFHPVGHLSLDTQNPYADGLDIEIPSESDGAYWIKSLYVLSVLRSAGIGRSAMDQVEAEAINEPLNARHIVLDTVHHSDASNPEMAKGFGRDVPKVTNHQWYARRGYRDIGTARGLYEGADRNGKEWDILTVFMQRDLV